MARRKAHKRAYTSGGEHWTKMLRSTMETPAWRALTPTAQALYPWLKLEWKGVDFNNNGAIRLSVRQAAKRIGVIPDTAAKAFQDLQRKGFIVVTEPAQLGVEGEARSPAYEITELKMPASDRADGRKLFKEWRPGHDFPVVGANVHNPSGRNGRKKPCHENHDDPVMKTMTKDRRPVMKTMTACHENHDEHAVFADPFVMKSMTSLPNHVGSPKSAAPRQPAPTSGPAAQAGATITQERARALIRAAVKPMFPAGDDD